MDQTIGSLGRVDGVLSTRRQLMKGSAAAVATLAAGPISRAMAADAPAPGADLTGVKNGRIKQSVVNWCFADHWDVEKTCQISKQLGLLSLELIDPKHWPTLKKYGLTCAIAGSHGFVKGMNNPKYRDEVMTMLHTRIDQCAEAGVQNVISFTGMREDIPDDVGARNCVEGFKEICRYAEPKKVTICIEMLNSRATGHMKGHPGYQGDHTDYCIDIIKKVGSERMKLLFDIYHVQIMDGDVINRIKQWKDFIGHVHTAGNPGRGELDDTQEINYRPIMKALLDIGYQGFVGQEFIPTREPLAGLAEAVRVCDV